ncbi:MAG TPA: hypothetical protein VK204_17315 [Nocardioidaceae bacterium]|nr:hypothetical protein [Nocardioidaceae bacterium]
MTITLDAATSTTTVSPRTQPLATEAAPANEGTRRIALIGDLTCPWSYLASRRAALLESEDLEVDWRMVEHDRPVPGQHRDDAGRVTATRRDLARVLRRLLPGEELPHALGDFVPYTRPAVSGYAEAYLAGVGRSVRALLFDAFWVHRVDLGNARLVRSLLADTVRRGSSPSELLREWGYAVDVTGAPVTTAAWHLTREWQADWSGGRPIVPILVLDDGRRLHGVDAVEWLGAEVIRRGIFDGAPHRSRQSVRTRKPDLVDLSWATEHGNRWMRTRRAEKSPDLFTGLRRWV